MIILYYVISQIVINQIVMLNEVNKMRGFGKQNERIR